MSRRSVEAHGGGVWAIHGKTEQQVNLLALRALGFFLQNRGQRRRNRNFGNPAMVELSYVNAAITKNRDRG